MRAKNDLPGVLITLERDLFESDNETPVYDVFADKVA